MLAFTGVVIGRGIWDDRGALAAAAFAVFWLFCMWTVLGGGPAGSTDFHVRHPYLDAAVSIPLAALFVVVVLPGDWPAAASLIIGGAYIALVFGGAWRRDRRRKARCAAQGRTTARAQ